MPMISTLVLCLTLQGWYGPGKKFNGFIPTPQIAVEVAEPLLKAALGESWVHDALPLKAELILGRWVVSGTFKTPQPAGSDITIEPFFIAIDKWSARAVVFGQPHLMNIKKELSKIPPDGPKPAKGKK
jgi:hypothetical protein